MSSIIMTKKQRKKIEKLAGEKIRQAGLYHSLLGEDKWYITLDSDETSSTASELDMKGADVCVCSYEKEEYIDEKCVYDSTHDHHSFKVGAGEEFSPRGFFWDECITTYYCSYTLKTRVPLDKVSVKEDITSIEVVFVERRMLEQEICRIMQLSKAEILERGKELRETAFNTSLFREGIRMRHNKVQSKKDENTVYLDIPKEIVDKIAIYKGVIS